MDKEPLPVFDCLFCCQEHFVLFKMNEHVLSQHWASDTDPDSLYALCIRPTFDEDSLKLSQIPQQSLTELSMTKIEESVSALKNISISDIQPTRPQLKIQLPKFPRSVPPKQAGKLSSDVKATRFACEVLG